MTTSTLPLRHVTDVYLGRRGYNPYRVEPDARPADIEETAEAYLLGRLTPEAQAVFEDHFITCIRYAETGRSIECFREVLRSAAERLSTQGTKIARD